MKRKGKAEFASAKGDDSLESQKRPAVAAERCCSWDCVSLSTIAALTLAGVISTIASFAVGGGAAQPVRVQVFGEPLCPGFELLANTSISGIANGRGVPDIVDLDLIPVGGCNVTEDGSRCSCPHDDGVPGGVECQLARAIQCAVDLAQQSGAGAFGQGGYWPFV